MLLFIAQVYRTFRDIKAYEPLPKMTAIKLLALFAWNAFG